MLYLPGFIDELLKIAEAEKVEKAMQHSVASVPELTKKLKPGDVLFTAPRRSKMRSAFGKYLFKPVSRMVQRTDYGHSSIYVGNGKVMEARIGEGTKARPIAEVAAKNNIVVMRPKVPPAERRQAVRFAKSQKGVPYSTKDLLSTLNPFRGHRKGRKPEEAKSHICSGLIANAYARRKFSDAPRLTTKPVELMKSPHMKPVAALEPKP